jgi:TM2 domain-containing membrane protein YozV
MKKWIVIATNFVLPGLGSLIAGENVRGFLQLLIVTLGVLLWLTVALRLGAVPLVIFAWLWGMFTALTYKQRVEYAASSPVAMVVKQRNQRLSTMRPERG